MSVEAGPSKNPVVLNRVRRAQGQLGGVQRMMEEGRSLSEVVSQLKAVTRALDKAAFTLLVEELRRKTAEGAPPEELEELERVFLALA
ncbi:metal-sensitive transcriptional regulator [Nocardioides sp. BP30]|uniref:metal-sensitive transcriptional regulator n=1 Tax=Nocardioides sp. BP30 TaxID=3036374 RepID=UPI0024686C7A|nr:metal-sensitive transcriptional regulator [Nocardioides sp. BP30]WGL51837.1 metal-sensitive transcriptional regulator [Nocardioides sp. BP30]